VQKCEIPAPRTVNARIPRELERIVLRALARDIRERYQTAMEMHDDLQAFSFSIGSRYATDSLAEYLRDAFPEAAITTGVGEIAIPELDFAELNEGSYPLDQTNPNDNTDTIRPPIIDTAEHLDDAEPTGHYRVRPVEPSALTTNPQTNPDGDTEHVTLPPPDGEDEDETVALDEEEL
jgi:hypothetical protein